MSDLVKQIWDARSTPSIPSKNIVLRKAADRIEALEAALRKIAKHDMQAIAIDALHPKERIRPTSVESTNG